MSGKSRREIEDEAVTDSGEGRSPLSSRKIFRFFPAKTNEK